MALVPEQSAGFLLWHVTLRWQRAIAKALAPLDLTHVQFVLLASIWWLNQQGEEPNQLTLARHAGVDVKMTSQVIRSLEGKDLVERTADPADARARLLRVTRRGRRLAPRAVETVEGVDREFFSAASDPDQVLSVLRELQLHVSRAARPSR